MFTDVHPLWLLKSPQPNLYLSIFCFSQGNVFAFNDMGRGGVQTFCYWLETGWVMFLYTKLNFWPRARVRVYRPCGNLGVLSCRNLAVKDHFKMLFAVVFQWLYWAGLFGFFLTVKKRVGMR